MMKIPKLMHQIWIGPLDPPAVWLDSWKAAHPSWTYRLWTNADLENDSWLNKPHMDHYMKRRKYAGVADLMRYEILFRFGGILPGSDSLCLHPIDELLMDGAPLYTISTVYARNDRPVNRDAATPIYAAIPHHRFIFQLICEVYRTPPDRLREPPTSTGNRLMQRMIQKHRPRGLVVWPMHHFIPEHYNGWKYSGPDRIYAKHFWGTTRGTYHLGRITNEEHG